MKRAVVMGAGGFIGNHLVKELKRRGYWVKAVDLKQPDFEKSMADEFILGDLREAHFVHIVIENDVDEVYQLAADMGGAGYIFTGENDADILHNSAMINLNIAKECVNKQVGKVFYSSSACIYPEYNQLDPKNPKCSEDSAYPAQPDSEYGWEKLFSERLYLSFHKNYGLNVKIARFHNVYGEQNAWNDGKEKAPAAICRKIVRAKDGESIEVWGDGQQTRSFLYIDDCIRGVLQLMDSHEVGPFNIGSEEMISINEFTKRIIKISGKKLSIKNIDGPTGVRGRCSENRTIKEKINWSPQITLAVGMRKLYQWIEQQI